MKMKDYILDEIARGLYLKSVLEIGDSFEKEMGRLAVEILETNDEKRKEELIKEYDKLKSSSGLKRFDELEVEDVKFKFIKTLDQKISEFIK